MIIEQEEKFKSLAEEVKKYEKEYKMIARYNSKKANGNWNYELREFLAFSQNMLNIDESLEEVLDAQPTKCISKNVEFKMMKRINDRVNI